ncbi:MAG: PocR ligand-binding domain-containing protein [Spirochaetota bacterium]
MEIVAFEDVGNTKSLLAQRRDVAFDLEKAVKCIRDYSLSVGVNSFIIDCDGELLYDACSQGVCKFCKRIQKLLDDKITCSQVHLYGAYQAERFGGKYIFFCPIGLVHWASPIMTDGVMQGAILGGPVLMVDPEEFLMEDIISKNNITGVHVQELKNYVKEIQHVVPSKVSSLAELLFIVSSYISDIKPSQFLEEREYLEQQANISEYIHYIKTMGGDDEDSVKTYPIEKERELITLIASGDKNGARKILNEILGHVFFFSSGNFEVVKARVLELVVLLSRAALEGGAEVDEIFGLNYKYLNQIHDFTKVDQLAAWLSRIMVRFTDCVFNLTNVKHVDVIYKALNFIKKNYMNKISLTDVADHALISPSYFSKVFKDEMKCNFNTYLNRVRVDMSKRLLLNDSISLVDVAYMTGFEDQSYFSKVFKKITKLSPGKFRESMGRYKQAKTG